MCKTNKIFDNYLVFNFYNNRAKSRGSWTSQLHNLYFIHRHSLTYTVYKTSIYIYITSHWKPSLSCLWIWIRSGCLDNPGQEPFYSTFSLLSRTSDTHYQESENKGWVGLAFSQYCSSPSSSPSLFLMVSGGNSVFSWKKDRLFWWTKRCLLMMYSNLIVCFMV